MAKTLAEIRAQLQAAETRSQGNSMSNEPSAIYAHWNIQEGATARIRFLPDANTKNDFFWVEKAMIKLPFNGVKGQADSRPVVVQVPCMEMYGKDTPCPVLTEVRTWFKDPNLEEMGRKYWKKRNYLFQGFVRDNPMADDKTPENPIRRFIISPQIYNLIKNALMDPELESLPTDFEAGLDFTVKKTSKGGYADYSTSTWARKESTLSAAEYAAIEAHGLFDLASFLPKKPGEVELKVIKEMFEASVNGEEYDPDRWSQYYKPSGMNFGNDDAPTAAPTATATAKPVQTSQPAPWEDDVSAAEESFAPTAPVVAPAADSNKSSSQRAEDILAMIRSRQK
jgi:hypothetical protein